MTLNIELEDINTIAARYPEGLFDAVESYLLFIGHGHSGHSLIGALLDAHPEIVIANELNLARLLDRFNLSLRQIQALLLHHSLRNANAAEGWLNTGYRYHVPNSCQGIFTRIRVLGDKKGGGTSQALLDNPSLLTRIRGQFGADLRVISVIRNPFDVVSAMAYRRGIPIGLPLVERFFANASMIDKARRALPEYQFLMLWHEDFVRAPADHLERLYRFLGCSANADLLERCASLVQPTAHARRQITPWPENARNAVQTRINAPEFRDFLGRYDF